MGDQDPKHPKPTPGPRPDRPARGRARVLASGTTPPAPHDPAPAPAAAMPEPASAPAVSRTATLDDPLTTSLLAEVSRRTSTIDVSPEQIDQAGDIAAGDRDPDDSI